MVADYLQSLVTIRDCLREMPVASARALLANLQPPPTRGAKIHEQNLIIVTATSRFRLSQVQRVIDDAHSAARRAVSSSSSLERNVVQLEASDDGTFVTGTELFDGGGVAQV